MLALLWLTSRPDIMGEFVSKRIVRSAAGAAAVLVLVLNVILVLQTAGVPLEWLMGG
jgi:manganese transport protein